MEKHGLGGDRVAADQHLVEVGRPNVRGRIGEFSVGRQIRSLAGDARSRLRRVLTQDPGGWTDGVAADLPRAIRDFIVFRTGRRPR